MSHCGIFIKIQYLTDLNTHAGGNNRLNAPFSCFRDSLHSSLDIQPIRAKIHFQYLNTSNFK
jgi:hypothetical protein